MPVSKWFSIAKEGATTDGRKIQRNWIEQMAKNFDPKKYGARVNLEHFLSVNPESTFRAYGDVIELKTEEREEELHLLARVDATDDLVELRKKRQKVYSSIEVDPDFSDTGEAYLVGLAMTDSPASLGTEMMQFAATAKQNPFSARKQRPENLFSESVLAELEFTADEPEKGPSLLERITSLFSKHKADVSDKLGEFSADLEQTLTLLANKISALESSGKTTDNTEFADLKNAHEKLLGEFNALKTQLESEPSLGHFNRPPATGGADEELTDC